MSPLESSPALSSDRNLGQGSVLVGLSFILSVVLAIGALVVTNGDGAQAARELVARFSFLVFVSFLLVAPLAILVPARPLLALAQMRGNLRLAFVAASVLSLACVLMPATVAGEVLPASAVLYIGLNGLVLLVMLLATSRTAMQLVGAPGWRAIQLIASAYFWVTFLASAVVHLINFSGTSVWYPLVLTLLVATLGAIVAARFYGKRVSRGRI